MTHYIIFGISISFISWIVGMLFNFLVAKMSIYEKLSHLNFIKSKAVNKILGIHFFAWFIKNTFFSFFNQSINIKEKLDYSKMIELRQEMTIAEIGHLGGFVFVLFFAVYKGITHGLLFAVVIMLINVLMNLYPSLLQQYNKRRLDKLIARVKRQEAPKTRVVDY